MNKEELTFTVIEGVLGGLALGPVGAIIGGLVGYGCYNLGRAIGRNLRSQNTSTSNSKELGQWYKSHLERMESIEKQLKEYRENKIKTDMLSPNYLSQPKTENLILNNLLYNHQPDRRQNLIRNEYHTPTPTIRYEPPAPTFQPSPVPGARNSHHSGERLRVKPGTTIRNEAYFSQQRR